MRRHWMTSPAVNATAGASAIGIALAAHAPTFANDPGDHHAELAHGLSTTRQVTPIAPSQATATAMAPSATPCAGQWIAPFNDDGLAGETIYALANYGGSLVAGGMFLNAGGETVNHIALWDDNSDNWISLDGGVDGVVRALLVHNGDLIAGGHFSTAGGETVNHIARWDGEQWHALGDGFNNTVMALAEHRGELIAGGLFTHSGEAEVNRIARWASSTNSWHPLGTGVNRSVLALAPVGDSLLVGGNFNEAGGVPVGRIALWQNDSWLPISDGFTGSVRSVHPFGNALLAAGALHGNLSFISSTVQNDGEFGAEPTNRVTHWSEGIEPWNSVGAFLNASVQSIMLHDGNLFAAGAFNRIVSETAQPAGLVAQWYASAWHPLGDGLGGAYNASAEAMVSYNGQLVVAGFFATAGGNPATSIAVWDAVTHAGPADFNCDDSVSVSDLLILLQAWGDCPNAMPCLGDLNNDGLVNVVDLLLLLGSWG